MIENIKEMFDLDNYCLSKSFLEEKKWCSIVVRDYTGLIQCEWISRAFNKYSKNNLFFFNFSIPGFCIKEIPCKTNTISDNMKENWGLDSAVFSENSPGLFFKSDEYYIVCGEKEFMDYIYPVSFDVARQVFFSDLADLNERGKNFFISLWNDYASNKCS